MEDQKTRRELENCNSIGSDSAGRDPPRKQRVGVQSKEDVYLTQRATMKGRIPVCTLFALLVLVGCRLGEPSRVETSSDSAAVSFTLAGPGGAAIVVPVHLNGDGPHQFVVDTGATLTCIDRTLADSLQLPERRGGVGLAAGIGQSGNVRIVGIDSLRLGDTTAFDLTACVIDLRELQEVGLDASGLIGLNFLKSFRVTLDFDGRVLRLES